VVFSCYADGAPGLEMVSLLCFTRGSGRLLRKTC